VRIAVEVTTLRLRTRRWPMPRLTDEAMDRELAAWIVKPNTEILAITRLRQDAPRRNFQYLTALRSFITGVSSWEPAC
jgi:hypothetical protein